MRRSLFDESAHTYPKMYMITASRRTNALEDWLKFYLMPFLSNIFVILYPFEEPDNFVSILATLILAYAALLVPRLCRAERAHEHGVASGERVHVLWARIQ